MTNEELQKIGKRFNDIRDLANFKHRIDLEYGKFFYEAKQGEWFDKTDTTIESFLGDLREIDKTIHGYEQVYKAYCVSAGYTIEELSFPKNVTRLNKIKTVFFSKNKRGIPELVGDKDKLDEWIERARLLSTTDFNTEFKKEFKLKNIGNHKCKWNCEIKERWVCELCDDKIWHNPDEETSK